MLCDSRGLPITCSNAEALEIYDSALTDLWNYRMAAPKVLKGALELAPDFPMALIVRGYQWCVYELGEHSSGAPARPTRTKNAPSHRFLDRSCVRDT